MWRIITTIIISTILAKGVLSCTDNSKTAPDVADIKVYRSLSDGNETRVYDILAGKLSKGRCRLFCGCKGYTYAGHDGDFCWCGNEEGECCSNGDTCLTKISTSGVSSDFHSTPSASVNLFEVVDITLTQISGITTYGLVQDGKLQISNSNAFKKIFTSYKSNIIAETDAFWGCQSAPKEVLGSLKQSLELVCPKEVTTGQTFTCDAYVIGSDITSLTFSVDSTESSTFTNIKGSYIYSIGGDMDTNRYDDYIESFDWAEKENFAFININHEFHTDGKLKAFEAYISKTGCLQFMIVRPLCLYNGNKYSNYLHMCLASSDATEVGSDPYDYSTAYAPPDKAVYIMDNGRYATANNYTAPPIDVPSVPPCSFEVMFHYEVNATSIGSQTFVIPDDKIFDVKQGYVLGWVACGDDPADIGYYHIDPKHESLYPRYKYPEIKRTINSAYFANDVTDRLAENFQELIQATVLVESIYEEEIQATVSAGNSHTIKVTLQPNGGAAALSKEVSVPVSEEIQNLTLSQEKYEVKSGETFSLENAIIVLQGGQSMDICVNYGDGPLSEEEGTCHITTRDKTQLTHIYEKPGEYILKVRVFNMFIQLNTSADVSVRGAVNFVGWLDEVTNIEPIEINNNLEFDYILRGSGVATIFYNIHPSNNTSPVNTSVLFDALMSDIVLVSVSRLITYPVDLQCTVGVNDTVNQKSVTAIGIVEEAISSVRVSEAVALTNISNTYWIHPSIVGTNITFLWMWGDGTENSTSGLHQMNMNHTYELYGNKTITIYAWNHISNMTSESIVTIIDPVIKVSFIDTPFHTNVTDPTKLYAVLEQGTAVTCILYTLESDNSHDMTLVNLDTLGLFYIFGEFVYPQVDFYNVTLTCFNNITQVNITESFHVENFIYNLTLNITQEFSGGPDGFYDYIEENESLIITANSVKGENIYYFFDSTDGQTFYTYENKVNISYKKWSHTGKPYKFYVNASNHVSYAETTIDIFVERPVKKLEDFVIITQPWSSEEPVPLMLQIKGGDFFNCTWTFSDGQVRFVDYNEFLLKKGKIFMDLDAGLQVVIVNCSNRLYKTETNTSFHTYVPVKSFVIQAYSNCPGKELAEGIGERKNLYPEICPILFKTQEQKGTNVSNFFELDYLDEDDKPVVGWEYPLNNFTHYFNVPEGQEKVEGYEVTITPSNVITKEFTIKRTVKVILVTEVKNFDTSIGKPGDHILGYSTNFSITLSNKPYQVCCVLDLGIKDHIKYLYGVADCPGLPQYSENHQYVTEFDGEEILLGKEPGKEVHLLKYKYPAEGLYESSITCSNVISTKSVIKKVKVLDLPCDKPSLKFNAALSTDINDPNPTTYLKCWRVRFSVTAIPSCLKPNTSIVYKWSLEKVRDQNNGTDYEVVNMDSVTGSSYQKQKRELAYGTYRIVANATMYQAIDNVTKKEVPQTTASVVGYFRISYCNLEPGIKGGEGRAASNKNNITIDGSISVDPDVEPGGEMNLKFEWFCKQASENASVESMRGDFVTYPKKFHPEVSAVNSSTASTFTGCFGYGSGEIYGSSIVLDGRKKLLLQLRYFLRDRNYTLFMRLSKIGRPDDTPILQYDLTVTSEEVPAVTIQCVKNCDQLNNPSDQTKLSAVCSNCPEDISGMDFNWQMLKKYVGEPDTAYVDFSPPKSSIANAIKNGQAILVINAKTFPPGSVIKVKLVVKWSKDEKYSGFALKKYTVNSPPDISKAKCIISPPKGIALETFFKVTCDGIVDDHTPITYKFFFELNDGPQLISYKQGKAVSNSFLLPAGRITIKMQAIDQLKADSVFVTLYCEVGEANLGEERLSSLLEDVSKGGDAQAGSNTIESILTAAASNPTVFDKERRKKMKQEMLKVTSNMKVNNAEDASILIKSYESVLGDDNGIDDMNEVNSALQSIKKVLEIPKDEYGPGKFKQLTEKTIKVTGKTTGILNGNNSDTYLDEAREIEKQVASIYAQEILPGEEPFSFETSYGNAEIGCEVLTEGSTDNLHVGNYRINQTCIQKELSKIFVYTTDENGFETYEPLKLKCLTYLLTQGKNRFKHDIQGGKNVEWGTSEFTNFQAAKKVLEINECEPRIEIDIENKKQPSFSKLSTNGPQTYKAYGEFIVTLHVIDIIYNETSIFSIVRPINQSYDGKLFVFCNKDFTPSIVKYDAKCILPNPKPDDYDNMTAAQQLFWHEEFEWRCFILQSTLNQMTKGTWLCAVLNIPPSEAPITNLLPRNTDPLTREKYPVIEYTFIGYVRACLFRNKGVWMSNKGDEPSPKTHRDKTICLSNHLGTYGGGGPFTQSEIIDFTKAFENYASVGTNSTMLYLVITLLCIYLVFLIWARRKDLRDIKKRMVCELDDNHPNDTYFYEISVQTGNISGCSTTANVFIVLYGSKGESSPRELCNPERKCFKQNSIDSFLLSSAVDLGEVQMIQIWHNNNGLSPGWYLMHVQVEDIQSRDKYQFICDDWLDVAEGDNKIIRNVYVASKDDLMEFDYCFSHTASRLMDNEHIWFSVFMKPPQSSFTRVQRLTICFTLLMATLLANTAFYFGEDRPPTDSIKLAIIYITFPDVINGLAAALMILPLNLLLVVFFRKAAPTKDYQAHKNYLQTYAENDISFSSLREKKRDNSVAASQGSSSSSPDVFIDLPNNNSNSPSHSNKDTSSYLPYWLNHVTYVICFFLCVGSGVFVVFIGYNYGATKADQFIVSLLMAMLITVIFIQPFIVLVLTLLTLFWWKECAQIDEVNELQRAVQKRRADNDDLIDDPLTQHTKRNSYRLPDDRRLEESRQQRLKEKRMKTILKEIFVHLSFVVLCLMVCYSSVDPNSQRLFQSGLDLMAKNAITNAYFSGQTYESGDKDANGNNKPVQDAASISTRAEWFDWARYSVIEYLFPIGWYNRKETNNFFKYKSGFIADAASSKVLAMARFRQLRLKHQDTCVKHEVFKHLIKRCNGAYSYDNQLNESFNEGWKPLNQTWNKINREGKRKTIWKGLEDPWKYSTMEMLQNFPFFGRFATYDGASYSVSIGPKKRIAKKLVYAMKDNFWIDRYTRAIFTEANIYNANTNLLLLITVLHEILPTGGWNYYPNVQAIRLYRYVGGLGDLIIFFDLAFLIVTFYSVYKIIRSCKRDGVKAYMSNLWHILHVIVTTCSLMAFAITIVRNLEVKYKIIQYTEKPEEFVSFNLIGLLENLTIACLGFVLFFTNLEFLRILRFNQQIALMSNTMSILGAPLGSFGMTFFVIFMSYISLAHCLFVDKLEDFKTVMETLVSLSRMFMGQFNINDYFDNAPYLGPILFFTYMLSVQMVMINLFVGLICDAYAESGESDESDSDDGEKPNLFSFVKDQVKNLTNDGVPVVAPIYSDWKDNWEVMMDDFEESCDSCLFKMKNMEIEETRHEKFFDEGFDDAKKDILIAVVGLDYFQYDAEFCDGIPILDKKLKEINVEDTKLCLMKAAEKKLDSLEDFSNAGGSRASGVLSDGSDSENSQSENESSDEEERN